MTKAVRRYGGISLDDRKAERRARLVEAAIKVSARIGRDAASVAAICAEAQLTARYFYESFANRDALFVEAFRKVQDELFARIEHGIDSADPVRSALEAFFAALVEHPGPARVFLLDLDGQDQEIRAMGRDAGPRLGQIFSPQAQTLLARAGAVGAILQIAKAWISSGFATPLHEVVATAHPFVAASSTTGKA